jgi:hypothetical protein
VSEQERRNVEMSTKCLGMQCDGSLEVTSTSGLYVIPHGLAKPHNVEMSICDARKELCPVPLLPRVRLRDLLGEYYSSSRASICFPLSDGRCDTRKSVHDPRCAVSSE